jgi:hypothetical protein
VDDRLVPFPLEVAQEYAIEGWGVAAGTEAQWCHHFEFSDIFGEKALVSSWNNVFHCVYVLARALIPFCLERKKAVAWEGSMRPGMIVNV